MTTPLILNVDDTEIASYTKRRTLEHAGFQVADATTGREALDKMAALQPPLVLLDVRLPDISGIDVCRLIKERWPTTMVLQTSATYVTPADRARGLQGGADAYLVQPIDADELIASVRALLRLHAAEETTRGLNASLEQRIAERTRELHEANQSLIEQIRQREQAEAALVQAQKMEVVGQLTGTMVHDFNNILASMNGYIHLVRRLVTQPDQQAMLDKALATAERGKRLTSRLLAFSRNGDLVTGAVDIGALLLSMQEWLKQSAGSLVQMSLEVAPGEHVATTDASQLELAVLNLVINARDAMPHGGRLLVSVQSRQLDQARDDLAPGTYVVVTVSDSGTGMPPEIAGRAFDAFFTTKSSGRGTGLGLVQVQTVARLSQGAAVIDTTAGQGTQVALWLASAQGGAGGAAELGGLAAADLRGRGERLLVVDDEADIRRTVAELLQDQGYRVVTAASGEEGLKLLAAEPPAMVLLDCSMPGMSGLEVARRARHAFPGLPILFITAYADRVLLASQFPQHRVLAKPFKSEDLFAAVAERLRA